MNQTFSGSENNFLPCMLCVTGVKPLFPFLMKNKCQHFKSFTADFLNQSRNH